MLFITSCNVKSGQIEKNSHAPLKFKRHVEIEIFLQSALGEGHIPDVLANQAQGTQHPANFGASFLSFHSQLDVEILYAFDIISISQPERDLRYDFIANIIKDVYFVAVIFRGGRAGCHFFNPLVDHFLLVFQDDIEQDENNLRFNVEFKDTVDTE